MTGLLGLKCADGLRAKDTVAALRELAGHPAMKALEIVEYIPELDENLRTAHLVRDLLLALLRKSETKSRAASDPPRRQD